MLAGVIWLSDWEGQSLRSRAIEALAPLLFVVALGLLVWGVFTGVLRGPFVLGDRGVRNPMRWRNDGWIRWDEIASAGYRERRSGRPGYIDLVLRDGRRSRIPIGMVAEPMEFVAAFKDALEQYKASLEG